MQSPRPLRPYEYWAAILDRKYEVLITTLEPDRFKATMVITRLADGAEVRTLPVKLRTSHYLEPHPEDVSDWMALAIHQVDVVGWTNEQKPSKIHYR
jgi:hypothetical protein